MARAAALAAIVWLVASIAFADAVPACPPLQHHERGSYHGTGRRCIPDPTAFRNLGLSCACPFVVIFALGAGLHRVRSRGD